MSSPFIVNIHNLPAPGESIFLSPDADELKRLATECAVTSIANLDVTFRLKRWRKNGVIVSGDVIADVEQECIKTLDPVYSRLVEHFERQLLPKGSADYKMPEIIDGEMVLDPEANDIPDELEGNEISLWDILVEEMILAIDPFPRSDTDIDEIASEPDIAPDLDEEPTHRPFSDLKTLITEKKINK